MPYIHPNSLDNNSFQYFPEIFDEADIDFATFLTALGFKGNMRAYDFFSAQEFLFGSIKTRDLNMLFSAVQRLYGYEHKDFSAYLKKKSIRRQLLNIKDPATLLAKIEQLEEAYNSQYGMSRLLFNFYDKWLGDDGKRIISSKIAIPADYYDKFAEDASSALKQRIAFLIKIRNGIDHAAVYHPLAMRPPEPEYVYVKKGSKVYTFFLYLTFQELYDATKKAMADFWISEFNEIYQGDTKKQIEDEIKRSQEELFRLNLPKRNRDLHEIVNALGINAAKIEGL